MALFNITDGSKGILVLGNTAVEATPAAASSYEVPFMSDMTVNTSTGVTRYKVLNSSSEKAFTTPSTNSISLNVLLDNELFFGNASATGNQVEIDGLFQTQNNKTEINFSVCFEGTGSGANYLKGSGFISGLSPTFSMDNAVVLSPITIEVNGDITADTV